MKVRGHRWTCKKCESANEAQVDTAVARAKLLGHKDVSTTMICTHVLNRGGRGVVSPLDR